MWPYLLRRLILLPITLFFILLVNFVIINLAPGDPVTASQVGEAGVSRSANQDYGFKNEDPYTSFREYYGLTLPILWNGWPWISKEQLWLSVERLATQKWSPSDLKEMNFKQQTDLRIRLGDQARFVMPLLLSIAEDPAATDAMRQIAIRAFVRGGTRQAILGPSLAEEDRQWNRKISKDNLLLRNLLWSPKDNASEKEAKINKLKVWYEENKEFYQFEPSSREKAAIFFIDTRFARYFKRVLSLDFGTLRNDDQKTVVSEVIKRLKYTLTLSVIPLIVTFVFCQLFGLWMAATHNRLPDRLLNLFFLILFAIPVFVVAPFLIEKVAMNHHFPFTDYPIPLSGFTSSEKIYSQENSWQRLVDIAAHLVLPLAALIYGSLATQSRLSRTAILEVLKQDYVRTARSKGVPPSLLYTKHVGRNAAITIVTSVAGSLGVLLAGSLIVETLFQINGIGRFFYEAIVNRDYNVMMFSALAGAFLSLLGYVVADLCYSFLDPRVTFD